MALITPFRDEGADEIISIATYHFEDAIKALRNLTEKLEAGEDASGADVLRAARDARAAAQTLFDERKRVATLIKKDARIEHDYGFDFDAARDEVRGLLDSLGFNADKG